MSFDVNKNRFGEPSVENLSKLCLDNSHIFNVLNFILKILKGF